MGTDCFLLLQLHTYLALSQAPRANTGAQRPGDLGKSKATAPQFEAISDADSPEKLVDEPPKAKKGKRGRPPKSKPGMCYPQQPSTLKAEGQHNQYNFTVNNAWS